MRKAMLAVALFAFLPATALAGPDQSARPAKSSPPAQIASLGGDFPTSLSSEDLANADADSARGSYSRSNISQDRSREGSQSSNAERQPQADAVPNGQPKYVRIYWFIGGH